MGWSLRNDPGSFRVRWSDEVAARYRSAGYWRDTTLVDVARSAVRAEPERVLLIECSTRLTRAAAWEQACRLASFLLSRGLGPGDVISFQLPNWVEAAVIALASRMTGLVLNPIPPIYRESELTYILEDCGSKLIFVPQVFRKHDHRAMLEKIRPQLPGLRDVVFVRGGEATDLKWADTLGSAPVSEHQLPKVDA